MPFSVQLENSLLIFFETRNFAQHKMRYLEVYFLKSLDFSFCVVQSFSLQKISREFSNCTEKICEHSSFLIIDEIVI